MTRERVAELLKNLKENYYGLLPEKAYVMAIEALEQEPKAGHWISGDDKCPCCGKSKFEGLDADIWADWQPNYCPNCGAKMVEPQESEDKE